MSYKKRISLYIYNPDEPIKAPFGVYDMISVALLATMLLDYLKLFRVNLGLIGGYLN